MPPQPSYLHLVTDVDAIQANFARSLLWRAEVLPEGLRGALSDEPLKRFNVYRNNIFASLTGTLRSRFPVIERLVGPDFFAQLARTFIPAHPPQSPVLLHYGDALPAFLRAFPPVLNLPYLPDVARLELAISRSYHAADAEAMNLATFAAMRPDDLLNAKPVLHSAVVLLSSPHPIVSIWQTNTHDDEVRTIGANLGVENVLVVRQDDSVRLVRLDAGAFVFLECIAGGETIEAATDTALRASSSFDLLAIVSTALRAGAISRIDRTSCCDVTPIALGQGGL